MRLACRSCSSAPAEDPAILVEGEPLPDDHRLPLRLVCHQADSLVGPVGEPPQQLRDSFRNRRPRHSDLLFRQSGTDE